VLDPSVSDGRCAGEEDGDAPHPCELLLALEGIDHHTTRVRSPRTNGSVERMNRTLLDCGGVIRARRA
jgi:hypothetical protein